MRRQVSEQVLERERVEWVFGLTGGELDADPSWTVWEPHDYERLGLDMITRPVGPGDLAEITYRYSYDGAPDEAQDYDNQYRTILCYGGGFLPYPAPWMADGEGIWVLVQTFTSSGEAECPGQHEDAGNIVRRDQARLSEDYPQREGPRRAECVLCAERIGSKHGHIGIGEGYEAVYRLVPQVVDCRDCGEDDGTAEDGNDCATCGGTGRVNVGRVE